MRADVGTGAFALFAGLVVAGLFDAGAPWIRHLLTSSAHQHNAELLTPKRTHCATSLGKKADETWEATVVRLGHRGMKILAPDFRSALFPRARLTTAASDGTMIVFSPHLYFNVGVFPPTFLSC